MQKLELSAEARQQIAHRVAYMVQQAEDRQDPDTDTVPWVQVLEDTFREFMPRDVRDQAPFAAHRIVNDIAQFEDCNRMMQEDSEACIRKTLERKLEGLPMEQQCNLVYQIAKVTEQCMISPDMLVARVLKGEDYFTKNLWEEEASQVPILLPSEVTLDENFLKSWTDIVVMQGQGAVLSDQSIRELCNVMEDTGHAGVQVIRAKCGDMVFRALTIMAIYTLVKTDLLPEVPQDVTLDQVALAVCAQESMRTLISQEREYENARQWEQMMRALNQTIWNCIRITAGTLGVIGVGLSLAADMTLPLAVSVYVIYLSLILTDEIVKPLTMVIRQEDNPCLQGKIPADYNSTKLMEEFEEYRQNCSRVENYTAPVPDYDTLNHINSLVNKNHDHNT